MNVVSISEVVYNKKHVLGKFPKGRRLFNHKYYVELSNNLFNKYFDEIKSYVTEELKYGFLNSSCVDLNISLSDVVNKATCNLEASASAEVRFEFIKLVKKDLKDSGFYVFESSDLDDDLMVSNNFFKLLWHYVTKGSFTFYTLLFVISGLALSFGTLFLLNS